MSTIMDILTSVMLGGVLLVIITTATDVASEHSASTFGDRYVQESLLAITQMVEGDFRNMGFGVPDSQQVVLAADQNSVTFRVDLRPFGSVDTLSYFLGPVSELSGTQNDLDRYLYRRVGNGAREPVGIVTDFRLRFISSSFAVLPVPLADSSLKKVQQVEFNVEVQNPHALRRPDGSVGAGERDALYSSVVWRQTRLAIQNLDR